MSVEHMASLFAQRITRRRAIRGVMFLAAATVIGGGAGRARAQSAGGGPPPQPPAFAPSDQKFPGDPPAADVPRAPIEGAPVGNPEPPKWPGTPWKQAPAATGAPSPLPPPPAASPRVVAYPPPVGYPPPPAAAAPVPAVTASPAPPAPAPDTSVADPQGDRVVLLPTATTHPAGTFFFSNYELVILQAGYAFTDDTQVSLTAIPAPSESLTILDVSLKTSLYRGGLVRAAAIGSVSGAAGKDVGLQLLGRAGGVVQVCTSRRCDSSLSLSSNVMLAGALLIMVNGAGGIWRMTEHVSVLAELATMVPVGTAGGQFNGALLGGGIRLHYTHWGFDFAALHILDSTADVSTVPFLALTWLP